MRSDKFLNALTIAFLLAFFTYLFGPLIIMSITAFNSSQFPRVIPFECFSVEWFNVLINDNDLMEGLKNSIIIGIGVVTLAVPIGLAGALMLTQVAPRLRAWYYTVVISPILIPGVVLGISTLVFWRMLSRNLGADFLYDGILLTIIGQATFIAAYSMLVFLSRLQRFDSAQEEAALDLGATHVQTFRKVLLPFLKPAIGSAAVLAFLASFENYNTTVFTILSDKTLTTVLASKVRYGINPSISALAVIIVFLTLLGAVVFEIMQRREQARLRESAKVARGEIKERRKQRSIMAEPAMITLILVTLGGVGTVYMAGTLGVAECKAAVKAEKRAEAQRRIKEREQLQMFRRAAPGTETGVGGAGTADIKAKGTEGYQSIFAPSTLEGMAGQKDEEQKKDEGNVVAPGTEGYQNIFAPSTLEGMAGQKDEEKKE
ncbi:MAG: ABC transporter permease [Gammaproteobacteria bacterium]|nr:ABC transporter permease [Gammaproteobacteria bacterium]